MTSFSKGSTYGLLRLYAQVPDKCLCPACGKREVEPMAITMTWEDPPVKKWVVPICGPCQREKIAPQTPDAALERAGLRGHLKDCYLQNFAPGSYPPTKDALDVAWNFCLNPGGNLWLYGATGTGKTHLAAGIAHEIIRPLNEATKPLSTLFAYVPSLLDDLRAVQMEVDRPSLVESRPATVGVLILDDFGAHRTTPFADEALDAIVNERWLQGKRIVVTSNLTPDEASARISDRMVSRIIANADVVDLGQRDYRLVQRKGA